MPDSWLSKAVDMAGQETVFQECPDPKDWRRTEDDLELQLPKDYKEFVSKFGSGRFGDDFYLLNPCANGRLQLSAERLHEFKQDISGFLNEMQCRLYPDRDGLLVIASTTSRIHFALDTTIIPRESSLTMIDCGLLECEGMRLNLAELVCRLYLDELDWAKELRRVIWTDPDAPFFTPFSTP